MASFCELVEEMQACAVGCREAPVPGRMPSLSMLRQDVLLLLLLLLLLLPVTSR